MLPDNNSNQDTTVHSDITVDNISTDWKTLYNSDLWTNSELRRELVRKPIVENNAITSCYTCRGKIRNYEITSPSNTKFSPGNHSTPKGNKNTTIRKSFHNLNDSFTLIQERGNETCGGGIPSISRRVDRSFRQKYTCTTYNPYSNIPSNQARRIKSLEGINGIFNFASTESLKKKKTQLKACSISLMIVAVVVICIVLVNFSTPSFLHAMNKTSTTLVPTVNEDINGTSSAIISILSNNTTTEVDVEEFFTSTNQPKVGTENINTLSSVIAKIRKNIKTYPKINLVSELPKDIINRDLSNKFCKCQRNEVCMLDEDSGTSICKVALDIDDPTGCGGLCALETEACQLVDKERGIRVCRLLTLENCSPHDWRCRNGLCVPAEGRCDGTIQCYDRSDEKQCECDLTKEFRCGHSLSCFPNKKVCDGVIDCWDGFDEVNCTLECTEDQFPCNDGQCILSSRFCDGFADCTDGSDEPHGCDGACGTHELQCNNHRCISIDLRCDSRDDCGDNTDEMHCSQRNS